jgi:hypothetical protein
MNLHHPQWLAAAWLREAGEHRPALDILRSDEPLSSDLRSTLAQWIATGSKRRRGAKIPDDPWLQYPPRLAASLHLASTRNEERAWMIFVQFPSTALGIATMFARDSGRGRPETLEGVAATYVARKLGITERTAREWRKRFFPNGLLRHGE